MNWCTAYVQRLGSMVGSAGLFAYFCKKTIMSEINLKPDWPENTFDVYRTEAKLQLGNLWSLSSDATKAVAGNLQLRYIAEIGTWFLFDDMLEIGRFRLPFSNESSLARFQRLCSVHYRSE